MTTDSAGNIYLAGAFTGFIDIGEKRLTSTSANDPDLFVAKLDRQGKLAWSHQFDETGDHYRPYAIAPDGDGGIVFCGLIDGSPIDFGGGQIAGDHIGSYIVRLDDAGGYLWHNFYAYDHLTELFVDRGGSIVVSSMFGVSSEPGHIAQIDIETGATTRKVPACDEPDGDTCGDYGSNLPIVRGPDNTVAAVINDSSARARVTVQKYDSFLSRLWSIDLSSPDSAVDAWDLASDGLGNIYIMGGFSGQLEIENGVTLFTSDPTEIEAFLVKLSALGEYEWGKSFGGVGRRSDWTMSVSDAGQLAIFGSFSGSLDLGGGALTTTAASDEDLDFVLAKLDAEGSHLWSRQFVNSGGQVWPSSVITDSEGTVLIAGSLEGAVVDFGTGALDAAESWAMFLARFPGP
ncbi:hypothetical protein [Sorangium sp. So ce1078]|uniref:hypothetical protein n=1 Tax=Sorangium sp. So ce1078 TaxID=3133329 RepID=UPI003F630907